VPHSPNIYASAFSEESYWWKAWRPHDDNPAEVPSETDVVIIGGGYTGLACALELRKHDVNVVVLEAGLPGMGASTLSGGQTSGGLAVGKKPNGKKQGANDPASLMREQALMSEAAIAYDTFEQSLEEFNIQCDYHVPGRVVGAWIERHLDSWRSRIEKLNTFAGVGARMLSREELSAEVGTDFYCGGVLLKRVGLLHPALLYGGYLEAAKTRGVTVCSNAKAISISKNGAEFQVMTARGVLRARNVVLATNGYTGDLSGNLKRRVIPVTSHQIATEELPPGLAEHLIANGRGVTETKRVSPYYRLSPDGKRILFGGRARFYEMSRRQSAKVLHTQLVSRFPQLQDFKIEHSWGGTVALTFDFLAHVGEDNGVYYAMGCNGSGVTIMPHLGRQAARMVLDKRGLNRSYYETPLPAHALYSGKPWFMPALGSYYQARDMLDRTLAKG
jgi:glycine/D-amino acid oxidase-like deaminating enzyme